MSDTICTHHNDQQREACPVCLVTALTAERDELRFKCDDKMTWASHYLAQSIAEKARADKAEAELAAERARLDWLNGVDGMDWFSNCDYGIATRAAINAAMKEDAK